MLTIWKYPLALQTENEVKLQYVKILGVYADCENTPCLYALVDTEAKPRMYQVLMVGTGWELDGKLDGMEYLGTFKINDLIMMHTWGKEMTHDK